MADTTRKKNTVMVEQLQKIIEMLPAHIYWKDTEGKLLGCNNQQAIDLGFKSWEEVIGLSTKDILPIECAEAIDSNDREVVQSGKPKIIEETEFLSDGSYRIWLSEKAPLYDDKGDIIGIVGISFDITERKKMEKELQEAKERAEAALKAKAMAEEESRQKTILLQNVLAEFKQKRYYLAGNFAGLYLTCREIECGYYLMRGMSTKEIGRSIGLSPRTVEEYLNKLKVKLQARSKSELIAKLIDCEFLGEPPQIFD